MPASTEVCSVPLSTGRLPESCLSCSKTASRIKLVEDFPFSNPFINRKLGFQQNYKFSLEVRFLQKILSFCLYFSGQNWHSSAIWGKSQHFPQKAETPHFPNSSNPWHLVPADWEVWFAPKSMNAQVNAVILTSKTEQTFIAESQMCLALMK